MPAFPTISLEPGAVSRHREPVTVGVPFPRGAVRACEELILLDASGAPVPFQGRVLDRWGDESLRWALIDFQASTAPGTGPVTYALEPRHGREAAPVVQAIVIAPRNADVADRVSVNVGPVRFTCARGSAFPLAGVEMGGVELLDAASSGLMVRDADAKACSVETTAVRVEESGPLRAVVVVEGVVRAPSGDQLLEIESRVHLYAGHAALRVQIRLRNPRRADHPGNFWDLGDTGSVNLEDASLVWTLSEEAAAAAEVISSPEIGAAFEHGPAPFALYQDSSGGEQWNSRNHMNRDHKVLVAFRGYRQTWRGETREGLRATPVVTLARGGRTVSATMRTFWQNCPKAIEADGRSLTLRLFPAQFNDVFEIQGGEQKTHDLMLAFGSGGVSDSITPQPLAWARDPLVPRVATDWICGTEAVPYLVPAATDPHQTRKALINAAIEGDDTFVHKREIIDEYGWRHFGDVYGDHENAHYKGARPVLSHYNNQYDTIAGFLYQFLQSGDPRWWSYAIDLTAHVIDIDVYHTDQDKAAFNHGMFWHTYHYGDADTATHRTYPRAGRGEIHGGGPSADHNYTTGLMLHYFLTGDPVSRQTVLDLAQYVLDIDDGRKTIFRWLDSGRTGLATASGSYSYHGPGRGPANSLNALIDGHRLSGRPDFLAKADEIVHRCVHPREDVGVHDLLDAENKWFYAMFFQSLGKYLDYRRERGLTDASFVYARESLLHFARWMATHEGPTLDRKERLHFPTETWAAQDIRKSDILYYASAYAADPAERARFRERAAFFFDYSIRTLTTMPTRSYARPIIVLLSSGILHAWFDQHPQLSVAASGGAAETSFPPREVFVPQKARAKRRLMLIAAAAGFVAIAGTVALIVRLFF